MALTVADGIKNRWQEYTEKLYEKDHYDPDNHDGVITYLEPDILECQFKRALGSITKNKAGGGDGVPVELFQILKDDAVKALTISANLENSAVATGLEKVTFSSNLKKSSKYHTTALISHASKVMLKFLQARLQHCMNHEFSHVQGGFRKGRRTRDQFPTSAKSLKKQESCRKTFFFSVLWTISKPLTVWVTTNFGKL